MKIAIIGGAGVRTPLLVRGLAGSDLRVDEIALFDIDTERLALIAPLAAIFAPSVRVARDARSCVDGADFVFLTIRAGGLAARARDEAIAIAHHVVGQETVGAVGFAMAMRTVPAALEYARLVESEAPRAWIVNFANPVSIVTQAITASTGARVVGICDTPTELFEAVARSLQVDASRCYFDYFGLNHLGWLREVYCDGVAHLSRLWADPASLVGIYRTAMFDPAFLQSLRLLPTEYLFFYYHPEAALNNTRRAGRTRGAALEALTGRLFRDLAAADGVDRPAIYAKYLQTRDETYLQIESGAAGPIVRPPAALTGYDRIAVSVVRAMALNANAIIPLNVPNRGALRDFDADDVVEVPCVVNASGARPLAVGEIPESAQDLMMRVKDFEWLTLRAASTRADADAVLALARHPLVNDGVLAGHLVRALQPW